MSLKESHPLELNGVTCEFPGVRALDDINLRFSPGEIHALAGENGAGKTTLLKVISGLVSPKTGQIQINGRALRAIRHPREFGVRVIPQEPELALDLSIAENILLGHLPRTRWKTIDWPKAFRLTRGLLKRVGLGELSPQEPVARLALAEQQLIEIARALDDGGEILLFDEPTASLSPPDVERLGVILKELRQAGKIILYVSHRLEELFSWCDSVSVLRDGKLVGRKPISETSPQELIRMMVGREVAVNETPSASSSQEVVLKVEGIQAQGAANPVSFELRRGEIVGVAGLVGAGRTELLQTIFGVRPISAGRIVVSGKEVQIRSPKDAINAGIAYVPEDRKQDGLALGLTIADNLALPNMKKLQHFGLITQRSKRALAQALTRELDIRHSGTEGLAMLLSGGNQQKIVLGKWLGRNPSILLLDEPTRGIDVGAKSEIHRRIRLLAEKGMTILLASSELPDLLSLSDRILVMRKGKIAGELNRDEFQEEAVLQLATPGYREHH
ncbi:MAG: sugar ABC transporter ATP-binding protein [Terriglobia bacterium]